MPYLVLVTDLPGASREPVEIGPDGLRIGRREGSEVRLPDPRISGLHAEILREGDALVLVHRSGTNTTRLNDLEVSDRAALQPGDVIRLSESIELRVVGDAPAETVVRRPEEIETQPIEAAPTTHSPAPEVDAAAPTVMSDPGARSAPRRDPKSLFVAIIGSGPAGIAAGVRAAIRGVPHVLLERTSLANTIERYQVGKKVMAEPTRLDLQPDLQVGFQESSREEVLGEWVGAVQRNGVTTRVGPEHEVVEISGEAGAFEVRTKGGETIRATHVVIAVGMQGNLNRFGVPGDDMRHVTHQLDDPAAFEEQSVVVVGVGDAGIENALALTEYDNRVAIVNRGEEFVRAKSANRSLIEAAIESGKVTHYKNTTVDHFEERCVFLKTPEGVERVEADLVIGRLGAKAPRAFLERLGIVFPSPSQDAVPVVSGAYESNVPGIHLIGAVAGYPLIKNCLNQGFEVIEHILGADVVPADEAELVKILEPLGLGVSEAIERIRATVPLFSGLTPIQLRDFLFDSKMRRVALGETVYKRNDFDNTLLAVVEGHVGAIMPKTPEMIRLEMDEQTRTQLTMLGDFSFTYGPGDFFGEIGLLSGRRRGETVEALSDCVLIEAPRLAMNRLLNSSEEVRGTIDAAFALRALERLMPGIPSEERKSLALLGETRRYDPESYLFKEGEEADGVYLIRRGSVALSQQREGRDVVLQYVQAGNLIGERGVLSSNHKRSASVKAKTLVEVLWMPADSVREILSRHPDVEAELRSQLARRAGPAAAAAAEQHRGTVMFLIDQTGAYEATDLLVIDESLCVRCDNCEKACAETHGGISRLDREAGPTYQSSSGAQLHLPTACQHCENPKCMDDCPPDALHRDPNGEVYVRDNCIGCGNCVRNCPYGVIKMAAVEKYRPKGPLWRLLFGEKPHAASGDKKAVKCDLCMELDDPIGSRKKAACVASCPTGAIVRANPRKLVDEILERV